MWLEESFIFFPSRYPDGQYDLADAGAGGSMRIEDGWFDAEDGVRLHGWYCRSQSEQGSTAPVLLWFHGNAGNLSHRYDALAMLTSVGLDVAIMDYRGYGRSDGRPSEEGMYLDARAAWRWLVDGRGIDPGRIIIFGKSLGGVAAIDLLTRRSVSPAGTILQSTFTSIADMAAATMPLVPRFLLHSKMDSLAKVSKVTVPKLFVHSRSDEIVPFEQGRRLYEAASEPKSFYEVQGAGHNDTFIVGGEPYLNAMRRFALDCVRGS